MKIFLETQCKDAHRIVFVGSNGKLMLSGEWCKRKTDAKLTYNRLVKSIMHTGWLPMTERPYKLGAFAKNSGPKKKAVKSTTKKKK